MAKIIVLMPNAYMLDQAKSVIKEHILDAKAIITDSDHVLTDLERERELGALVAVARGNHAHLIKNNTDMPLAEICLNGQELMSLIHKAQTQCKDSDALIAFVGFSNMFTDPDPIAKVLNANVGVYYAGHAQDIERTVDMALEDGAAVVIGGEIAIHYAEQKGIQTLFLDAMESSISDAIMTARRILFGIEAEKRKTEEFLTLLNHSFDAILKLNPNGDIVIANYLAESAFHTPAKELIGKNINALMDIRKDSPLANAIAERNSAFSAVVRVRMEEYVANLAALSTNGVFEGYILSMQEFRHIGAMEAEIRAIRSSRESVAQHVLSKYTYPSKCMQQLKTDAAVIAQYDLPVLIAGAFGTDKGRLAECIHNASIRHKRPFVHLDLSTLTSEMQEVQMLPSVRERNVKTAFEMAYRGTLLIENVDLLGVQAQAQLLNIVKSDAMRDLEGRNAVTTNVRIICTTDADLEQMAHRGEFSRTLYTHLSHVALRIPSLIERMEDMDQLIREKMEFYSSKYKKYVRLNAQVRTLLAKFSWIDDELGLSNFIEKMILFSSNNEADEVLVQRLLPIKNKQLLTEYVAPIVSSSEEAELLTALQTYHGNRTHMAQALNISTTTLWRRMKKYNLMDWGRP